MIKMHLKTYKEDQLARWGLLKQVQREEIIDDSIAQVPHPNDSEKKEIISRWLLQNQIKTNEDLDAWQSDRLLTNSQWEELVIRKWLWSKWCELHFQSKLQSYYLQRKPYLDKVTYSMLRVKEKSLATELFLRIKEGESLFEDIAANYSEGPERTSKGRLGPVPMSQPHPALSRLLQISEAGQLWSPKQLENWWIVVRLEEIINTELNDEIRLTLSLELGDSYLQEILKSNV